MLVFLMRLVWHIKVPIRLLWNPSNIRSKTDETLLYSDGYRKEICAKNATRKVEKFSKNVIHMCFKQKHTALTWMSSLSGRNL